MRWTRRCSPIQMARIRRNRRARLANKLHVMKRNYKEKGIKGVVSETSVVRSILLSIICCVALSYVLLAVLSCFGISLEISDENRDIYLSIITTHVSVVFLTTSLIASLSEKDEYVYWVNIVREILIKPVLFNFHALCTYAFSTVAFVIVGCILTKATWVITGCILGNSVVLILFYRMISIYYSKENISQKYRMQLRRMMEVEGDIEELRGTFEQLANVTLIEAENKNFENVLRNCDLFCYIIQWNGSTSWKNIRIDNGIVTPLSSEKESASVILARNMYKDLLATLAYEYPKVTFRHIKSKIGSFSSYERENYYQIISTIGNKYVDAGDQNGVIELIKVLECYYIQTDHGVILENNKYVHFLSLLAKANMDLFVSYIRGEIGQCYGMLTEFQRDKNENIRRTEYLNLSEEVIKKIHVFLRRTELILDAIEYEDRELYSEVINKVSNYYFDLYTYLFMHHFFDLENINWWTIDIYFLPFIDINSKNEMLLKFVSEIPKYDTRVSDEVYCCYLEELFYHFIDKNSGDITRLCVFFEDLLVQICCFNSCLYSMVPRTLESLQQEKVAIKCKMLYLNSVLGAMGRFLEESGNNCEVQKDEAYRRLYGTDEEILYQELQIVYDKYKKAQGNQSALQIWDNSVI